MANLAVHINDFNMATSNEETTEVELIITELPHSSEVDSQSQKSNFSVEGNTFDKEMFLQALREYKCLWDTSDPNYKNRNMKVNAWNALSSLFNQEVAFLQKIYKNLKDSLKKCLDKRRAMTRSGAPAGCLPTCKYFELMRFLHEKTSNLPTHSNVDISPAASSHVIETACSMSPLSVPASPCTLTTPTPERPIDENTSKKRKRPSSEKCL
ncbi:uncharacterized protein LOC124435262 [Xenia sp. Carnegie-2017]|uniref:uncharacterized protein LOC124435262 n=1 Tax=Xenia sp. Carnegie-2017 TaxID=2897299 RepID=UPI001F03D438|nr:uncharacterized protein LOC124435262 [Xenia sp. Carnegie-2017]